jgi:hypothetical protein
VRQGPGVPGPDVGQIFNVFTLSEGRVVRRRDFLTRRESSHSLRAELATAAPAGVPEHVIAATTGHKAKGNACRYKGATCHIDADTNDRITWVPLDDSTVTGAIEQSSKEGVDGQF